MTEEIKNKGGRPPSFESVEDLIAQADSYFKWADDNQIPYTIEGLCLFMDCHTDTLLEYEKKDEFSLTIKKYKMRVLNEVQIGSLKKTYDAKTATLVMQTLGSYTTSAKTDGTLKQLNSEPMTPEQIRKWRETGDITPVL